MKSRVLQAPLTGFILLKISLSKVCSSGVSFSSSSKESFQSDQSK
ncbi:hypothetical protein LEP1GSC128_0021 [Leptospira borgpetersenii str. 200801926]|uniref:Lipoprotein n=1 Tax=Leptospira borgpetersenii str. 200801926 TaxID=1193009 RepID=A0ABN0HXS9_LEPBO|nr:hypothetical protein LEP1GSC128_0021 [Leptospira borgpetersenii str. 200801926]